MIEVGQTFKNYRVLCEALGQPVKTGGAKVNQLAHWQTCFLWEQKGQALIITTVIRDINQFPTARIATADVLTKLARGHEKTITTKRVSGRTSPNYNRTSPNYGKNRVSYGYIYIFTDSAFPDCVKIGMSINPIKRLRDYQLHKPYATVNPYYISTPFKDVYLVEQKLLKALDKSVTKDKQITAIEWFDIKDIEIILSLVHLMEEEATLEPDLPKITLADFNNKLLEDSLTTAIRGKPDLQFPVLCAGVITLLEEGDLTKLPSSELFPEIAFITTVYEKLGADKIKELGYRKQAMLNCYMGN